MGFCREFDKKTWQMPHGLTPFRVVRGLICLTVLLLTSFMVIVYCGFIAAVLLRFFSIPYSRKGVSFFFGAWISLWPFLFEKVNKTKVIFSGEIVPARERILLIANHRTEVDWMYLWDLAMRKGRVGYIKYVLKKSLIRLPVFGWAFHILEFISVERKWKVDELVMHRMLSTFKDNKEPLWLALFPEGTDFTEEKCLGCQRYAAQNGLPVLQNVLLPKPKGFCACLKDLRSTLDAVYDLTIGYKHPRRPTLLDNVFGLGPSEVHIHIRRIPLDEIPASENEIADWLVDTFRFKDRLLSAFYSRGLFSQEIIEGDLSTLRCIVNFIAVIALTSLCTLFTLFSSVWFKIYVSLACAYLASATYFDFRPPPVVDIAKAVFTHKPPKH